MTRLLDRIGTRRKADADPDAELPIPGFVRVNLLPEAVRERAKVARAKRGAAVAVGGGLALSAGWLLLTMADAGVAEKKLSDAETESVALQAQLTQLAVVPQTFAQAQSANEALASAMGDEIRWSFLLNQLSFSTPAGVTLDAIQGSMTETEEGKSGSKANAENIAVNDSPVGNMQFTGLASDLKSVASWLDSLESLKDYTFPFFTSASRNEEGDYAFQSVAGLTDEARSGRYSPTTTTTTQPPNSNTNPNPAPPSGSTTPSPGTPTPGTPSPAPSGGQTPQNSESEGGLS